MKLTAQMREAMYRAAHATLLLRTRDPHPTVIQRFRAVIEVELRDGTKYEFIEEAWA